MHITALHTDRDRNSLVSYLFFFPSFIIIIIVYLFIYLFVLTLVFLGLLQQDRANLSPKKTENRGFHRKINSALSCLLLTALSVVCIPAIRQLEISFVAVGICLSFLFVRGTNFFPYFIFLQDKKHSLRDQMLYPKSQ